MSVTVEAVQGALKSLIDPNTGIDFVAAKNVKNLRAENSRVKPLRSLRENSADSGVL